MCIVCKRGGLVVNYIGPALIEMPPKTVQEVIASLIETTGGVGRIVLQVFLNGKNVTNMPEMEVPWNSSLRIVSSAF